MIQTDPLLPLRRALAAVSIDDSRDPTMRQMAILLHLAQQLHQPSVKDIAAALGYDKASVTRSLDRLEFKLHLLSRVRGHEDRRLVAIALTDSGRDYVAALAAAADGRHD